MVEETTAAAQTLRVESQELSARVDIFDVGQKGSSVGRRAA
jgi:methyl-accepting chemotaxis protein